jgi:hypothetical protein
LSETLQHNALEIFVGVLEAVGLQLRSHACAVAFHGTRDKWQPSSDHREAMFLGRDEYAGFQTDGAPIRRYLPSIPRS